MGCLTLVSNSFLVCERFVQSIGGFSYKWAKNGVSELSI